MLSSLFETLRVWPGVRRSALSRLVPPADAASAVTLALVLDGRCARALRALGYGIVRPEVGPASTATPALIAVAPPAHSDWIAVVRAYAAALPPGARLLLRGPLRSRERIAAAFLHAALADMAQLPLGRSVLTTGTVRG